MPPAAVVPATSVVLVPTQAIVSTPKYIWDTQEDTRHSIRVICDESGLDLAGKNDITACIYQESEFFNILPNGKPIMHQNYSPKNGLLTSTDWGLCEFNDTRGWYIGPAPLPFPSVQYLLDNPEKAVRVMIQMYKDGQIDKWVSHSSGAYKQWLPYVTMPVPASGHYPIKNFGVSSSLRGTTSPVHN